MPFRPTSPVATILFLAATASLDAQQVATREDPVPGRPDPTDPSIGRAQQDGCDKDLNGLKNPFINCGFEDGFAHWVIADINEPFLALQTASSGKGAEPLLDFFVVEPADGKYAAITGFDGDGPGTVKISQDVELPFWATNLQFDYRAAWDFAFGATPETDRAFRVLIEPSGGGPPLAIVPVLFTEGSNLQLDTGPRKGGVPIDRFAGQAVRVSFEWVIPESRTGPGLFQLDKVQVTPPIRAVCGDTIRGHLTSDDIPRWHRINLAPQPYRQTLRLTSSLPDHADGDGTLSIELFDTASQPVKTRVRAEAVEFAIDKQTVATKGVPGPQAILIAVRGTPARTVAPLQSTLPSPQGYNLEVTCMLGAVDHSAFETAGWMNNDRVGSAGWHRSNDCPEDPSANQSRNGIARWGNPGSCTDYATSGPTTDVMFERFALPRPRAGPTCPGSRRQLAFSYRLEFEDDAEFDRARVDLAANGDGFITVLDNGPTVGGLMIGGDDWQQATVDLPETPDAAAVYAVRFIGETTDDLNNFGRGFLIDDVRIECRTNLVARNDFELGKSTWASGPTTIPETTPPQR